MKNTDTKNYSCDYKNEKLDNLLYLCSQNDRKAQAEILARYENFIKKSAYHISYSFSEEEQQDFFQEVMIKIFSKLSSRLVSGENFQGWLYTVIQHSYIDALRSKCKKGSRTISLDPEPFPIQCAESETSDYLTMKKERAMIIHQVLDKLTQDEKNIILLYFYKEKTIVQISQLLNLPPTTVFRIKDRALQKIHNIIGSELYKNL